MIKVVNLRIFNGKCEKVDRTTILGNPFVIGKDGTRDEVCDLYEPYFNKKVKEPGAFRDEVVRLWKLHNSGKDLILACWCAPLRCHGDYIKSFLENFDNQPALLHITKKDNIKFITKTKLKEGWIADYKISNFNINNGKPVIILTFKQIEKMYMTICEATDNNLPDSLIEIKP